MVNINEFRIGNYYKCTDHCKVLHLKEINYHNKYLLVGVDREGSSYGSFYDEVNPIALSPQFFRKMGFNEINENEFFTGIIGDGENSINNRFVCVWFKNGVIHHIKFNNDMYFHINSIHHLQNLYYMSTNVELKIV